MAHEVEKMAYVGATPWHGLGEQLPQGLPFDDWFLASGLNWEVLSQPALFQHEDSVRIFKGQKVLYRSDTLAPLSVVSDRYHVVQPRDVLEFYRKLVEKFDFTLETAGVLRDGKRVWALARTKAVICIKGDDVVRPYLLLATSYDGTFATTVQPTDVRVVCNNTLQWSLYGDNPALKITHTTKFNIDDVHTQLGFTDAAIKARMEALDLLARCKLDVEQASVILKKSFRVPETIENEAQRAASGHLQKVLDMFKNHDYIGSQLEAANESAWGLVNCVTEYVDFRKRARTSASRLDSAWFGEGSALKARTFNECMKVAA